MIRFESSLALCGVEGGSAGGKRGRAGDGGYVVEKHATQGNDLLNHSFIGLSINLPITCHIDLCG